MRRCLLAATAVAAAALHAPAFASSHREAPGITQMPKLDGTDFYMFRSYEKNRAAFVTMIADYLPLQDVYGGPNFFNLDPNGIYDINIDNSGRGRADMRFRFRFTTTNANLTIPVGGANVPVPLVNIAPVSAGNTAGQNVFETFTLSLVTPGPNGETETPITSTNGQTVFQKPLDNIGNKSIADYHAYAQSFIYAINIPGCARPGRVFAGQRKDPFVVNLGETFDLINYANPVGEKFANSTQDSLSDKNVTSLAIEVPIACLTRGSDPVIGGWTTSAQVISKNGGTTYKQVSRLGNPLVNEVVIGLPDKDKFNASSPADDAQFITYVTNPSFPALVQALFGTPAPTAFPRTDLEAVFLTGLAGINAPQHLVHPSEEMRLNTSIMPTPANMQGRMGVIGNPARNQPGDLAGYPNGRRPGDDVVDITLRVAMGRLYTLGLFGTPSDAPSGALDFTDGAFVDASHFDTVFPYARDPLPGSVAHTVSAAAK